jgi:ABC-type branched-subunit amino acid transport system substrate-binding protein
MWADNDVPELGRRGRTHGHRVQRLALIALVLVGALLAAACGSDKKATTGSSATTTAPAANSPAKATGDPFVVGWTDSQTGVNGPGYLGTGIAGLQTYVDDLNNRGGVFGRPVKLEVLDDRSDAPTSVTNFRQLADGKSLAIFGSSVSSYASAQVPLAEELKVALVAGGVPDALTTPPKKYFFSSNLSHTASAQVQLDFSKTLMKKANVNTPKVAIFTVDTASATEFRNYLTKQVGNLGWNLVKTQTYAVTDTDVSAQVANIARAEPDLVLTLVGSTQVPMFVTPLRQRGINKPVVNTYAGSDEPAFAQLKDEQFIAPRSYVWPTDQVASDMGDKAKKAGVGDQLVSTYFTHGYVLGQLVEETLKACGKDCDRAKFRDALETVNSLDAKGLAGKLGFSPTDHQLVKQAQLFKWDPSKSHSVALSEWIDAKPLTQ